ncbi:MAG: O-antigen ligase family protein [Desulfitobacteriaceae bacterium]
MSIESVTGKTLNDVSEARSNKVRVLAFSLWFSLLAHGLFFAREVMVMGLVPGLYVILRGRKLWAAGVSLALTGTDLFLFSMAGLSLLGLSHPIRAEEAWLDMVRFLIYWFVYRWSREVSQDFRTPARLIRIFGWAALALAFTGWLPWAARIWPAPGFPEAGRLSSWLGYPNATAAFLTTVLLLPGLNVWLKSFLFLSLLSTGSRSALALLLGLKGLEFVYSTVNGLRKKAKGVPLRLPGNIRFGAGLALLLSLILLISLSRVEPISFFRPAWEHLGNWALSNKSWGERLVYLEDGLRLAWAAGLWPRAGGWLAFPLVQRIPYWSLDPHSSVVHILLSQGLLGLICTGAWAFFWLRKAWYSLKDIPRRGEPELLRLYGAPTFLLLHSLVDADFAFAALGISFWILVGLTHGRQSLPVGNNLYVEPRYLGRKINWVTRFSGRLRGWQSQIPMGLGIVLSIFLFLVAGTFFMKGGFLLSPGNTVSGEISGKEILQVKNSSEKDKLNLEKALAQDQTQVLWRRQLAEMTLLNGDPAQGLKEIERVLAWRKFDLGAYEWAQGVVWEAAEVQRSLGNSAARPLYQWAEQVPLLIKAQADAVPVGKRYLWPGYASFCSTPYIDLVARYARERTLHPF